MPRVLIVEDEPAASRYLRSLIELTRPLFTVDGIAGNGREALERIRASRPDLVVTDVRMPVMDGIAFVEELKREFPSLPAVIVSGYQEFEYARRALNTGVVDYLLKPVDPARLGEVLDRLGASLSEREREGRAEALRLLVAGCCVTEGPVAADELFWMAVAREGGLPSRFSLASAAEAEACCEECLFVLPGRDSRELIFLGQERLIGREAFADAVRDSSCAAGSGFRTTIIRAEACGAERLREAASGACLDLDRLIVVGLSQVRCGAVKRPPEAAWDKGLADRIEFALRESRMDRLEEAIRDLASSWRSAKAPLISVESQLRRILHFVLASAPRADASFASDLEFRLEDALASAADFVALADAAWSLVARAAGAGSIEARDPGVPEFFNCILRYVECRYADPLSLSSLSETFRISSSYLSKLFRQRAGRSFGEFLLAIRIDAAKRLIRENPGMPLKEVAECVGFNDPFYFSRAFKSIAGLPPSDYSRRSDG